MSNERIEELARKFLNGKATAEEIEELHKWYDAWQDDEESVVLRSDLTEDVLGERILSSLKNQIQFQPETVRQGRHLKKWYYVGAAAVLIFIFSLTMLLGTSHKQIAKTTETVISPSKDVPAPNISKATIVLDDGSRLSINDRADGMLARQGGVRLLKTGDGQIVYQANGNNYAKYNTLDNPRGSRAVSITLSDGTRVWLNAESSLRYPVAFSGADRTVEVTGEAYFEVTHNASKPFRVKKGDVVVTVLGTHFNVNTYEDESNIKVTLLEGSVRVSKANAICVIRPGQQAMVTSELKIIDDVNIDQVMAWKNGKFQFGEASDIRTIMKEIARWYDLDVEYRGIITDHIGGTISRDSNASQVFKKLEMTGVARFQINGKKVVVMPK